MTEYAEKVDVMVQTHNLKRQSAPGHGSWMLCIDCGAVKHTGFLWLAGMKSKIEPPCVDHDRTLQNEWFSNAENVCEKGFSGGGASGAHD